MAVATQARAAASVYTLSHALPRVGCRSDAEVAAEGLNSRQRTEGNCQLWLHQRLHRMHRMGRGKFVSANIRRSFGRSQLASRTNQGSPRSASVLSLPAARAYYSILFACLPTSHNTTHVHTRLRRLLFGIVLLRRLQDQPVRVWMWMQRMRGGQSPASAVVKLQGQRCSSSGSGSGVP